MKIRTNYYIVGERIVLIYAEGYRAEHGQSSRQHIEKVQRHLMDKLLNIRLSEERVVTTSIDKAFVFFYN